MAKLEIPITFGTGLVFIGMIVLAASIYALLVVAPNLGFVQPAGQASVVVTQYLLTWMFVVSGFVLIFMGIRRIRPI